MDYIITCISFQPCISNGFRAEGGRNWFEMVRVNSVPRVRPAMLKLDLRSDTFLKFNIKVVLYMYCEF